VTTTVTAVVVAYGAEPWLERCVAALVASPGVDVVVVDNGDTTGAVDRLAAQAEVQVIRPGSNTGFAQGCNLGAAAATGDVLALVNPDAIVEPAAMARLAAVAGEPAVGIATASLRLAEDPAVLNSAGNPVHYLGLAWAGAYGEPAAAHAARTAVASASGACCALRRSLWVELGGFEPAYFAYHEDVELSLRCWQRGLPVVYVPDAVVLHRYSFTRNAGKNYLLERNRLLTVLTVYSARSLVLLAPALALLECALLGAAAASGWLPQKLAGYGWLLRHAALIRRRRRLVQTERRCADREWTTRLAGRFSPANVAPPPGLAVANAVLGGYWAIVRRLL